MTNQTSDRPSDTDAAHAPGAGAAEGAAPADQNFVRDLDNAERRENTGDPSIHGGQSDPTAGAAVADRLPDEAVAESGEDIAAGSAAPR